MNKYFDIITDSDYEQGGVISIIEKGNTPYIRDAEEVAEWKKLVFEIQDGVYMPFHMGGMGSNLFSEDLKNVITDFIPYDYPLEFLPVTVKSKEYGDKTYYILHFKIIFDVLDREHSVYNTFVPRADLAIIKPCLDLSKVENLHIFNSRPIINDIIISDKLRKAIKKAKLDNGIYFSQLKCM